MTFSWKITETMNCCFFFEEIFRENTAFQIIQLGIQTFTHILFLACSAGQFEKKSYNIIPGKFYGC